MIPSEAEKALSLVRKRLAESLLAVYLHGSAVEGGLRPHSDVDLLVIVDRPIAPEVREGLAADLMLISGRYPYDSEGRRPLELIAFLRSDLDPLIYPARSEFIYGEWLRCEYEVGKIPKPVCDPELTLLLAQARQQAIPLTGPQISCFLPAIRKPVVHQAIKDALPALLETLEGDERNVLLTLARMWFTTATGKFAPKDVAAVWAAARFPAEQAAILAVARETYLGIREDDWQNCRQQLLLTVDSLRDRILAAL